MVDLVVENNSDLELKMKKGGWVPASFFRFSAIILEPGQPLPRMRGIRKDRRRPQA